MSDKYELSRRKALIGLGTIGVAGAGAGMGTSALFSDEEEFEANRIEAGTLDMEVVGQVAGMSQGLNDAQSYDIGFGSGQTVDGAVAAGIKVADMKPGDWIVFCFDVTIKDNPGYLLLETGGPNGDQGDNTLLSKEGKTPEPETNTDTADGGELEEKLDVSFYEGEETDDNSNGNLEPGELGGDSSLRRGPESLQSAFDFFSDGWILRDDSDDFATVGPGGDFDPTYTFYVLVELPVTVGNSVQGDVVGWDLYFETQQVRNNPNPFDGDPTS